MYNYNSKKSNKKMYIGITVTGVIIILLIIISFSFSHSNETLSFEEYNPNDNKNIVNAGEKGLQYINTNPNAYIDTNSDEYDKKQRMLNLALNDLEDNNINNGIIDLYTSGNSVSFYLFVVIILLFTIGAIVTYATFKEDNYYN